MKKNSLSYFLSISLLLNFNINAELSENDPYLAKQKEECATKINKTWDTARNRCVEKVENKEMRKAEIAAGNKCLEIKDLEARKQCFVEDARSKTPGMNTKPEGGALKGTAAIVTHAYSVMSLIQMATNGVESNCTSKTIFGATSLVGSLSDIYLKIQTKKKLKSLQDKYKIDLSTGRHDAQVKALEYLKEEQETLADIASIEKKRNMIMMAGYGAALGFAIYEMRKTPACGDAKPATKPDGADAANAGKTDNSANKGTANQASSSAPAEVEAAKTNPIPESKIETTELKPLNPVADSATSTVPTPKAEMNMFTGTNGKTYVNGTLPNGQQFDVVGSKVFDPKGTPIGTFSNGTITLSKGGSFQTNLTSATNKARTWQPSVGRPSGWTLK